PPQAAGTVDVTVTTYAGTSATGSADHYTYGSGTAPAVTGLSLTHGSSAGGYPVTVLGTDFAATTSVVLYDAGSNPVSAPSFTLYADNALTFPVGPLPEGPYDVVVTTTSGSSSVVSADEFPADAVTQSAPAVTALDVATGSSAGGRYVAIT